jgi:hypothetical protein
MTNQDPRLFIDPAHPETPQLLAELEGMRAGVAASSNLMADVTSAIGATLLNGNIPPGLVVETHRDTAPGGGAYPYVYFKLTSDRDSEQIMRIDPSTGQIIIDDEIGLSVAFHELAVHPALSGLTKYIHDCQPAIQDQIDARTRQAEELRAAHEKEQAAKRERAAQLIEGYPALSTLRDAGVDEELLRAIGFGIFVGIYLIRRRCTELSKSSRQTVLFLVQVKALRLFMTLL